MQIIEITGKEGFSKIISEHKNVVVDFYSTECPPCEAFAPKFHALHELYGEDIQFIKIFRQENKEIAQEL
jgi:thiol-disulfide isomerase/thioredoxin